MPNAGIDPARLYQVLNNTGLQNKDTPLYQLLYNLIGQLVKLTSTQATIISGGGSSTTVINNHIQQLISGSDVGDYTAEPLYPPGNSSVIEESDSFVPYLIQSGETFTVPEFKQALYAMNIEVDPGGSLVVDGYLIEVDPAELEPESKFGAYLLQDNCCDGEQVTNFPSDVARLGNPNAFTGPNSFANTVVDLLVGQLKFPVSQNASSNANTLDDYEEGTWTPVDASGAGLTLTITGANYIKIGQFVLASFQIQYPVTADGSDVSIGGLPFSINAAGGANPYTCPVGFNTSALQFVWIPLGGTTTLITRTWPTAGAAIINSQLSGTGHTCSVIYRADT